MFAVALAGQMFRLKLWLAKLLGVAMVGWAVNCALLMILLVCWQITGILRPDWAEWPFVINALILGTVPALLYFGFLRGNEDD